MFPVQGGMKMYIRSAALILLALLLPARGQTLADAGTTAATPLSIEDRREILSHTLTSQSEIRDAKPYDFAKPRQVGLKLVVGPDGSVVSAVATQGTTEFYDQAVKVAMSWRYRPFERGGKVVFAEIKDGIEVLGPERRPERHIPFPEIENCKSLRITLSRTNCFGTCPGYHVEIRGDGTVEFNGGIYVALGGRHVSQISQEKVRKLAEAFRSADYFSTLDEYSFDVSDGSTFRTSIAFDGYRKSVVNYQGLWAGLPSAIADLELAIDQAAETQKWISITPDTVPSLEAENYFKRAERDTSVLATMIASGANVDLVRDLIRRGASLNTKAAYAGSTADATPLMAASERGDAEIVAVLLAAGAARNDRRQLSSALFSVAGKGSSELVKNFLDRGANPNYKEPYGFTVLMEAARLGNPEVVSQLLAAHADVNAKDNDGNSVLRMALDGLGHYAELEPPIDRKKTAELILAAGADWWTDPLLYANACGIPDWDRCTILQAWMQAHPRPPGR